MSPTIAVFSDLICPWCFVGTLRSDRALDLRARTSLEWLPVRLPGHTHISA
ncbi:MULTISPECIES: DsbA family protein [unclassified Methylobacterium]|jgi:predicted DsbA family dithiol-disulfide isomerase|uniref:DsbA family protein n=1 Tax=unclassified Methylobacterium TaxID=2615210 RepID=UPI000B02A2D8|nr:MULTISPECIES: DsbA family protein [unclassified Methylobacterium]